ncbi:SDR family NAD(P)-dependent oxidoreductase [Sphingosinicella terrae]|uniref:SDR family NAD(P)-dependent oxidoreductase n=1 Tax=Sphingosinicella terrae TaxID=2172047 RepID=UPI000E0DC00A|nr:SDR family oxidoreductase [Sphingosinicella terrae]
MADAAWPDLSFDFSGRRVLVTGGTSGIGAAIARAYLDAGADVTVTGTRRSPEDYAEDLGRVRYLQLDITDEGRVEQVAAEAGALDILVNSAGVAMPVPGDQFAPAAFDHAVRTHLTGVYRLAHACAGRLGASAAPGGGAILLVGSTSAYFGHPAVPGYSAAKAGLTQLVKTLAIAWAPRNIRVNGIAPGLTRSRMTAAAFENPKLGEPTLARTPLGRLGEPIDQAGAALFLTSSAAAFITGQTLPTDGGFTIRG